MLTFNELKVTDDPDINELHVFCETFQQLKINALEDNELITDSSAEEVFCRGIDKNKLQELSPAQLAVQFLVDPVRVNDEKAIILFANLIQLDGFELNDSTLIKVVATNNLTIFNHLYEKFKDDEKNRKRIEQAVLRNTGAMIIFNELLSKGEFTPTQEDFLHLYREGQYVPAFLLKQKIISTEQDPGAVLPFEKIKHPKKQKDEELTKKIHAFLSEIYQGNGVLETFPDGESARDRGPNSQFCQQFKQVLTKVGEWSEKNYLAEEFAKIKRLLIKAGDLYSDNTYNAGKPNQFFEDIKHNVERICYALHNEQLPLDFRKNICMNMAEQLNVCPPGVHQSMQVIADRIYKQASVDNLLQDFRLSLVERYVNKHMQKPGIHRGNEPHIRYAFMQFAAANGFLSQDLEVLQQKDEFANERYTQIFTADQDAFIDFIRENYTLGNISDYLMQSFMSQVNQQIFFNNFEKLGSAPKESQGNVDDTRAYLWLATDSDGKEMLSIKFRDNTFKLSPDLYDDFYQTFKQTPMGSIAEDSALFAQAREYLQAQPDSILQGAWLPISKWDEVQGILSNIPIRFYEKDSALPGNLLEMSNDYDNFRVNKQALDFYITNYMYSTAESQLSFERLDNYLENCALYEPKDLSKPISFDSWFVIDRNNGLLMPNELSEADQEKYQRLILLGKINLSIPVIKFMKLSVDDKLKILTEKDSSGSTALHSACLDKEIIKEVQYLFESDSDKFFDALINARDSKETTPFMMLCKEGVNTEIAKEMIGKMTSEQLAHADKNSNTALIEAVSYGHTEIAKALIENMSSEQLAHANNKGNTALIEAVIYGHTEIVKVLIDKMKQEQLALANKNGDTALTHAVSNDNTEIAKALIDKMTPDQLAHANKNGNTALIIASRYGHLEIVKALIENMTPVHANENGITALILASSQGHTEIAKALIDKMTSEQLAHACKDGNTALIFASNQGHTKIAKALIENMTSEQLAFANKKGDTALIHAVSSDNTEIAKALIDKMTPDQLAHANQNGITALICASDDGNLEIVKALIDKMTPDQLGHVDKVLNLASIKGHTKIAKALIEKMTPEQIVLANENGNTALIFASRYGHLEIVKALIENMTPEQPAHANENGITALIEASSQGHTEIAKALIDKMTSEQLAHSCKDGNTALILAARNGHTEIAKALIDKMTSEQLAHADNDGNTALILASRQGHTKIAKALIEKMTSEQLAHPDKLGATALIWAAYKGHTEIAKALIEEMTSEQLAYAYKVGNTALIEASSEGHTEIAKALMEKMTSEQLAHAGKDGNTALIEAVRNGHTEIAKALIDKMTPKQLAFANKNGDIALDLASRDGHTEIENVLEEKMDIRAGRFSANRK